MAPAHAHGFTLVELLVVITIIVVLLALLAPALDKAIEQAERTVCASRLHAWGSAHSQYFFDNRRKILSVTNFRRGISQGVFPNHARWRKTTGEEAGDFNLDDIAPYVQGANQGPNNQANYVGDAWYCPSSNDPFWYKNIADSQAKDVRPDDPLSSHLAFMYLDYAYFGLAGSRYRQFATAPDLLSENSIGEGKVLMTDTVFRYPSAPTSWWFNHSAVGYSMHEPGFNGPTHLGSAPEIGVNKLFADGSVGWHNMDHTSMDPPLPNRNAWVSDKLDGNGQPDQNRYVNFY